MSSYYSDIEVESIKIGRKLFRLESKILNHDPVWTKPPRPPYEYSWDIKISPLNFWAKLWCWIYKSTIPSFFNGRVLYNGAQGLFHKKKKDVFDCRDAAVKIYKERLEEWTAKKK